VTDFLVKHFPKIVDYNFTVQVEEEFDSIAHGKQKWNKMIAEFYTPFRATVDAAADISREEAQQTRELGIDPESGETSLGASWTIWTNVPNRNKGR